jgi:hypothetical protein
MIIECPGCHSRIDAVVIAEKNYGDEDGADPFKISFLECSECRNAMLARTNYRQVDYNEYDYDKPTRLWPEPVDVLHISIPTLTRLSLEEAGKCFGAQAYSACAVMCGKAIEAICAEHGTKSRNLGAGLKELKDTQIIDQRLFDWGEALREQRNLGAHATGVHITREDARAVLDFAIAICEYVFVLSQKYAEFKARQVAKATKQSASAQAIKDGKVLAGIPVPSASPTPKVDGRGLRPALPSPKPDDDEAEDIPF